MQEIVLFVERHPWPGDGFIKDWIVYLNDLKKLSANKIVPGHGSVGNNRNMDEMIQYIETMSSLVDDAIKNKLTEDEIKAISIPGEYKTWWFGRFFTPNLVIQYENKINVTEQ